jgi:hypothetical protein
MPNPKRKKEVILFALDVIFFIAALVPTMPVIVRWSLWFLCWIMTVVLVQMHFERPRTFKRRLYITAICILVFIASFQSLAGTQWREEKAAALEGDLSAGTEQSDRRPFLEIGNTGTGFGFIGPDQERLKIAYDAGLRIKQGKHGLEISTPIRDKGRHLIAKVENNHWSVSPDPSICFDKNYTENSLEVKDGADHVVFQIRILSDRIQLQGEWRDEFGHGIRIAKCPPEAPKPGGCITFWNNAEAERAQEYLIEPIFQYPSRKHWREFAK